MRIYQRGEIWYIDYIFQGKRFRKRIGKSRKVAELTLKDIEVKIAKREHLGIQETSKILFDNYAEEYLKFAKTNKSEKSYTLNITNIKALNQFFKGKYLSGIKPQDIEAFKAERIKTVQPATVNRDLACLRHMFNKAIQWGYLSSSPMKGIKLLKEPPGRLRFLSKEEATRLLELVPAGTRAIVAFALNTGMRKSEILNLTWKDTDLKNKLVIVEKTKTNERRIIPMNDMVYNLLIKLSMNKKADHVFSDDIKVNLRKSFEAGLKKAQIEDFRFHDLRHTFASHLVMAGASLKVIQQLLGHKDIKMTMRYSHLSQEHLQDIINRLSFGQEHGTNMAQTAKESQSPYKTKEAA